MSNCYCVIVTKIESITVFWSYFCSFSDSELSIIKNGLAFSISIINLCAV